VFGSRRCLPKRSGGFAGLVSLPAALALLLSLVGCQSQRQTLHVVIVPNSRLEWLQRDGKDRIAWTPLLQEYQRLHPGLQLQVSVVDEAHLEETLRRGHSRGLGPDLLVLRAPVANALLQQGLVERLDDQPAWHRSQPLLEPALVDRVTTAAGVSGLPAYNLLTLACFNRQVVLRPPASLDEMIGLAASGRPIGVAVDPIGVWWSAGALGAQDAMVPILTGNPRVASASATATATATATASALPTADRAALLAWLTWLRQLALQSRVDIASGPRELVEGLESGRLSWIPCYSSSLAHLERSMGKRLGVAPLPGGPAGPPTPFGTVMVMALGSDSSPPQRRLALELAELSLDPLVQREITLESLMVLPANRFVSVPVASSGRLAALQQAQRQFNQLSKLFKASYSADRLRRIEPLVEDLLWKVMLGVVTPQQGTEALLRLSPPS